MTKKPIFLRTEDLPTFSTTRRPITPAEQKVQSRCSFRIISLWGIFRSLFHRKKRGGLEIPPINSETNMIKK